MPPGGAPPPEGKYVEGIVVQRSSSTLRVDTGSGVWTCTLRGKLRKEAQCVAGDRVRFLATGPDVGVLEEILPRRSELRRGGLTGESGGKVVAANIDHVIVVQSAAAPAPRWALADRLLVEAAREGLESLLVVNKADLLGVGSPEREDLDAALSIYRSIGVPCLATSTVAPGQLDELRRHLRGRMNVLSGHSGVGKTSLINALVPGSGLVTREVNPVTGKGRHTTSSAVLVTLADGGYVMDTPGFREFALTGISPPELGRYYPEFQEAIARCRFRDCLHRGEPGCFVSRGVEDGAISKLRYQNYLQILRTLVENGPENPSGRSAGRGSAPPSERMRPKRQGREFNDRPDS